MTVTLPNSAAEHLLHMSTIEKLTPAHFDARAADSVALRLVARTLGSAVY
jgi:hypothetical protein